MTIAEPVVAHTGLGILYKSLSFSTCKVEPACWNKFRVPWEPSSLSVFSPLAWQAGPQQKREPAWSPVVLPRQLENLHREPQAENPLKELQPSRFVTVQWPWKERICGICGWACVCGAPSKAGNYHWTTETEDSLLVPW